ncbi:MAG: hypothetical protein J4431_01555 [Candidatus Aenigmarchaeota archaeon]|nr:hypothetical protein [Candidatus Aenigmarchaeota archaeon]
MKYLVAAILFLCGCVSVTSPQSVNMLSIDVSPSDVFAGGTATATLEFRNPGGTDIRNVKMSIFNAGALTPQECDFGTGQTLQDFPPRGALSVSRNPDRGAVILAATGRDDKAVSRVGVNFDGSWHYCYCDGSGSPACSLSSGETCSNEWEISARDGAIYYISVLDDAGQSSSASGAITEGTSVTPAGTQDIVVDNVKAGSFAVRTCSLKAPETIESNVITTAVEGNAKFSSTLLGSETVSMISEEEYRIRQAKGEVIQSSRVSTPSDGRLQAAVSFSEPMPVIARPDKKAYMYIDISNVGGGRIPSIEKGSITLQEAGEQIVDKSCVDQKFYIQGTAFPKIACEISMPGDINYLDAHSIILSIDYDYEIRASKDVQVRR